MVCRKATVGCGKGVYIYSRKYVCNSIYRLGIPCAVWMKNCFDMVRIYAEKICFMNVRSVCWFPVPGLEFLCTDICP